MKKLILLISLAILLSSFKVIAAETTCSNCSDCNTKLNESWNVVKLGNNIINSSGTCINNPVNFKNKVFDCQGYIIDGDYLGIDYGIYLNGNSNDTITNCMISRYYDGIVLSYSSNNSLFNNI